MTTAPGDAVIEIGGARLAEKWFDKICVLYDEVFSEPIFLSTKAPGATPQRQSLQRLMESDSFGVVTAHADGELVGFAYGTTLPPDTRWWAGFLTPVTPDLTTEWAGRTFALIDFAVRKSWRARGIGRSLHDTLLSSRPEERATVAVRPSATDTQRVYEHWGWQRVGRLSGAPGDTASSFDIFVRALG